MSTKQTWLCRVYALIALLALVGTWGHNIAYLPLGFLQANVHFWGDTLANPATRSITVDLFALCAAVWLWMVTEARRLGLRGVWWYVLGSALIAVSVFVPLFLIHRERVRARLGEGREGGRLTVPDKVGIALVLLATLGYTAHSFGLLPAGSPGL